MHSVYEQNNKGKNTLPFTPVKLVGEEEKNELERFLDIPLLKVFQLTEGLLQCLPVKMIRKGKY